MKNKLKTLALAIFATMLFSSIATADDIVKGKGVYAGAGACSTCHGDTGKGDGAASAALNPKPADLSLGGFKYDTDGDGKKGTEADVFNIITHGAAKYGGSAMMAGRPDLAEADRKALAKYIVSLNSKK